MSLLGLTVNAFMGNAAIAGVDGQFFFAFQIEGVGDFLGEAGAITNFVMEEKIGGDLPAFTLTFKTTDFSVINRINEGADVSVVFGKSWRSYVSNFVAGTVRGNDYKSADMVVQKFTHRITDSEFMVVEVLGLIKNGPEFLRDNEQKAWKKKNSVSVIKEVAEKYFKVDVWTSAEPQDEMNWLRPNTSPSKFIFDTWKRSYMSDNNALVYGIEMNGVFTITDIQMIMDQDGGMPKWFIREKGVEEKSLNTVDYNPNIKILSDFGLINNMVTHKKVTPLHSMKDGAAKKVETPPLTPMIVGGPLNMMTDQPVKHEYQKLIDTDNFHDNYSKARLISVPRATMMNSLEIEIYIENQWQDYRLFDLIHFQPFRLGKKKMEEISGIYCITKISRFYGGNRAGIKIVISRDGMNNMQGNLWTGVISEAVGGIVSNVVSNVLG